MFSTVVLAYPFPQDSNALIATESFPDSPDADFDAAGILDSSLPSQNELFIASYTNIACTSNAATDTLDENIQSGSIYRRHNAACPATTQGSDDQNPTSPLLRKPNRPNQSQSQSRSSESSESSVEKPESNPGKSPGKPILRTKSHPCSPFGARNILVTCGGPEFRSPRQNFYNSFVVVNCVPGKFSFNRCERPSIKS